MDEYNAKLEKGKKKHKHSLHSKKRKEETVAKG